MSDKNKPLCCVKTLTEPELVVLIAVAVLEPGAYGVPIQSTASSRASRPLSTGAVYHVLARLQDRLLVESYLGEPTPERGGRRKRLYRITNDGKRALAARRAFNERLWDGIKPAMIGSWEYNPDTKAFEWV
jgi:PadR family transcriptional regulator, regulatory protein PadR